MCMNNHPPTPLPWEGPFNGVAKEPFYNDRTPIFKLKVVYGNMLLLCALLCHSLSLCS